MNHKKPIGMVVSIHPITSYLPGTMFDMIIGATESRVPVAASWRAPVMPLVDL